jgi:hypothetical protein
MKPAHGDLREHDTGALVRQQARGGTVSVTGAAQLRS